MILNLNLSIAADLRLNLYFLVVDKNIDRIIIINILNIEKKFSSI